MVTTAKISIPFVLLTIIMVLSQPRAILAQEGGTATPVAQVEAKNPDANVRAGAGTEFDPVGKISPGTRYNVLGKRFEWYQIQFPVDSAGVGWVNKGVVSLFGDDASIPELDPSAPPTTAPTSAGTPSSSGDTTNPDQTNVAPVGEFTVTAEGEVTLAPGEPLPTFTPPEITPTPIDLQAFQPAQVENADTDKGVSRLLLIVGTGVAGLAGLFFAIKRRL